MGKTTIEWTDQTWNPTRGCRRISPGCEHCYAERTAIRMSGQGKQYEGIVKLTGAGPRWTGEQRFAIDQLEAPLRWRAPAMIFVDSMSDLFYEKNDFREIAAVFGVMASARRHTFQVLTKRPEYAREFFRFLLEESDRSRWSPKEICQEAAITLGKVSQKLIGQSELTVWPLPNVWVGCSVEDQQRAEERIPVLLELPAAVRFISAEPLLGPLELERWMRQEMPVTDNRLDAPDGAEVDGMERVGSSWQRRRGIDWVICGGESGPGARPMRPDWARGLRDQCVGAGVSFLFKQWGEFAPIRLEDDEGFAGGQAFEDPRGGRAAVSTLSRIELELGMCKVGKKDAGRELDGKIWDEFPERSAA